MREAPKAWADLLGEWGRPKDQMAHVEIWFDPDVDRWVLMECVPPHGVSDDLRLQLLTYPDATPFRRRQWEYYKAHGKIPLTFWIIQGEQGGHRLEYGQHEATLAQWYGGSREPPKPGSLPYAPFDQRVLDALHGYDRVISKFASLTAAYEGNAQAALEQMRRDILASTEGITEAVSAAAPDILAADLPQIDGPPPDYAKAYDEFVTTGILPGATGGSLAPAGSTTAPYTE